MKRIMTFFMAALCCAAASAQTAPSAPPVSPAPPVSAAQPVSAELPKRPIAVYVTGDARDKEKKLLANEVFHTIVGSGRYTAAELANDFAAAVAEEQKKLRVDDLKIREIARRYNIGFVCQVDVMAVFDTLQLTTRIVDVESGGVRSVGKSYGDFKSANGYASVSSGAVKSMAIPVAPPPEPEPAPAPAVETAAETVSRDVGGEADAGGADYYLNRAQASSQSKNNEGAVADYTEALKLDPQLIYALIGRGAAYYQMGNFQGAVDDYSQSLELDPSNPGIYNSRGQAYRQMGNYDMAIADYQAALRLDPNNTEAKEALELIMLEKKDDDEEAAPAAGEPKVKKTRKYRTRFGLRGSMAYDVLYMDSYKDYSGLGGYSAGIALSIPITGRLTVELETDYRYRSMTQERVYLYQYTYRDTTGILRTGTAERKEELKLEDHAVRIPLLLRFNTASLPTAGSSGGAFGFYFEAGTQLGIPLFTGLTLKGGESKPVEISDRNIDFQGALGAGVSFRLGVTFYAGYRGIFNITDFAGGVGWLVQHEAGLSVMF